MLETVRQVLNGEVTATWIDDITPPQPSRCLRGMLSLANGPQTLQEFDMTSLRQTWRVHGLCHSKSKGQYHAFAAPPPPPQGLTWRPLLNSWRVSSGTELDNKTKQDSKPPMFIRGTAVTRNWPVLRYVFKNSAKYSLEPIDLRILQARVGTEQVLVNWWHCFRFSTCACKVLLLHPVRAELQKKLLLVFF